MKKPKLCDYGCGQEAKHQFKNGKRCCSKSKNSCPIQIKKNIKSNLGKKHTIEAKQKIGIKHRNKVISDEQKEKQRLSMLGRKWSKKQHDKIKEFYKNHDGPMKGKKHSKDSKKKMSISSKGFKHNEESKIKISKKLKGKEKTEQHKENMSIAGKKKIFSKKHKENISKSLQGEKNPFYGKSHNKKTRKLISEANKNRIVSKQTKKRISKGLTKRINYYKNKYPIFSSLEEIRDKPNGVGIQVHCKNHKCDNSKEKGGWFTPTKIQLSERIRSIETADLDNSYFYCSDNCKDECPMFHLGSGRLKNYSYSEYNIWRNEVLKRANYLCEYCESKATDAHHSRPQKLEPGFSLDPDFGIACCEECHYKYGHKDECSTGNLAYTECL